MKLNIKLMLGSILASMLGLVVASPILVPNLALTTAVDIEVDVVYAYFSLQEFNSSITGLWRDAREPHIVSYFIVLNITNRSNKIALMREFEASAAELIHVYPQGGVSYINTIVYDFRDVTRYYPGWSQYWSPNQSRLIGLSGMVEVSSEAYDVLQSGRIYLFGKAVAQPYGGGSWSTGYRSKQVQLQIIGREFLYNALLSENQILHNYGGLDVTIETRR